jgi:hypothetical protein
VSVFLALHVLLQAERQPFGPRLPRDLATHAAVRVSLASAWNFAGATDAEAAQAICQALDMVKDVPGAYLEAGPASSRNLESGKQ